MFDDYLNSDELRSLTRAGSSIFQIKKLQKLGVPYALDQYGTPLVRRADVEQSFKTSLEPLYNKLGVGFRYPFKK